MRSASWNGATPAASNGCKFYDGPRAEHFNYDDPKLAETIQRIADMELKKALSFLSRCRYVEHAVLKM
jgi:hypothetical protein